MVYDTWMQMMMNLPTMSEDELRTAINFEVATRKRKQFVTRMHQRFSRLRTDRERQQLLDGETML